MFHRITGAAALFALVTIHCASVDAQPPDDELPEIPETVIVGRPAPFPARPLGQGTLLTPSRTQTYATQSGSSYTVITEEELAETRQSTVLEVLRGKLGLDVVQQGGPGKVTSVFLRGANAQHTKVLLDGIPLNDPGNASRSFDFSGLTVDNIERIEVVRGPQSVAYGSDAIGGVINIVTKRGQGPLAFNVTGMGGSYGTSQERVQVSGGDDCKYYSFSGSFFETRGFSAVSQRFGAIESDLYRNATLSGRFGWTPSDTVNVDYVFRYTDGDTEIDDFLADNFIRQNRTKSFFNRVQLQSLLMDGIIEQKVGYSLTDQRRLDTDPGFFTPQFDGQSYQVDWQSNVLLTETNVFTVGVDYIVENASSTVLAEQTQNLSGVYLQDQFSLWDRSFTTVGVRWDEHSSAGSAQTYRLTQLLRFDETGTAFHGSIGTGFRAPAIAERFGFGGDPNLRPEFSKGWDVGIEQQLHGGDVALDVTYFRNDFRDLVVFDFATFSLMNIGLARASGVETTVFVRLTPYTTVQAGYTFTDTVDLVANTPLLRRPKNKASFSITRRMLCDQASASLYFLYVGKRADFGNTGLATLADYITVNVSGSYQLNDRWEAFARVDNLTDSDYEEVFGFATPGISAYGGFNVRW